MSQFNPTADASRIADWITEQGLMRSSLETLFEGFCEQLHQLGLPIMRGFLAAQTLHPTISTLACNWRPAEGVQAQAYAYQPDLSDAYLRSPIKRLRDLGAGSLRVRLDSEKPSEFPICEELRQQGATDYFIQFTPFGRDGVLDDRIGVLSSWTTKAPEGFSENSLALLRHLVPRLALAVQARISQDISINLLDTYVGSVAGTRILDGEIRRGALDVISSVIFLADLRGFTAMSERTHRDDLVDMLNAYFDCLAGPIVDQGGNVLKFLGDGLLATFPLNGDPADQLCERALDAAVDALCKVTKLKSDRLADGKPVMEMDIALHLGDVYWGNVGSAERLDFTVIGPAVNEASRIEALCSQYQQNLLMSEAFADAAKRSSNRLVSIGRFALRGVQSAQTIYTLEELPLPKH